MFNVACKDPLDTERVGERRARKSKEAKDAVDSINDALSSISVSARTPDTPSFAFSPPPSGRSSRTSVASPNSQRSSHTPDIKHSSLRDYFSLKTVPAPTAQSVTKDKRRRESPPGSGSNPFAFHSKPSDYASQPVRLSNHVAPTDARGTLASAHISSELSRPCSVSQDNFERPQSTHGHLPAFSNDGPNPWKRFQRVLKKIEMTNDQNAAARLAEVWPADDDDVEMMHEFEYETNLWALVRAQKLLAMVPEAKDSVFPVPAGLKRADKETFHGANILHLGTARGSPESWYLGTKYTDTVIHSLGVNDLPFDLASSSWGLPPNVLLEQWSEFPRLDYVDAIFDNVIIAHHVFESIKCTLWPILIEEISRVLCPSGLLIVSIMDALPQRAGPLLDYWTHQNLNMNVLRRFMVNQPSLLLPSWVEEDGHFSQVWVERTEFPCMPALEVGMHAEKEKDAVAAARNKRQPYNTILPNDRVSPTTGGSESRPGSATQSPRPQQLAASRAGWNFYERLYSTFLSPSTQLNPDVAMPQLEGLKRDWWTNLDDVRKECSAQQPYFEMATFVYRRVQQAQGGAEDRYGQGRTDRGFFVS